MAIGGQRKGVMSGAFFAGCAAIGLLLPAGAPASGYSIPKPAHIPPPPSFETVDEGCKALDRHSDDAEIVLEERRAVLQCLKDAMRVHAAYFFLPDREISMESTRLPSESFGRRAYVDMTIGDFLDELDATVARLFHDLYRADKTCRPDCDPGGADVEAMIHFYRDTLASLLWERKDNRW